MGDGLDKFKHFNIAAEFFAEFAAEALLEGFVDLAFTAGKFPKATEVRVSVALGDEKFAATKNEAGGDLDRVWDFGSGVWD